MDYYSEKENNEWRQSPTESDNVRHSPTMSDHDGQRPTVSDSNREEHTLTTIEALRLFEQNGLLRSQRSIERYCKSEKLDCFFDPDEQRYYITRASTERLIGHLKEIQARHEKIENVGHRPTVSDNVGQRPTQANEPSEEIDTQNGKKIKELEDKIFNLEIEKRVKDGLVIHLKDQVKADREEYTKQLTHYTHRVGELETKLLQLEAPRERNSMHQEERRGGTSVGEHKDSYGDVEGRQQFGYPLHEEDPQRFEGPQDSGRGFFRGE